MLGEELISLGVLFLFVLIGGIIAARVKQPIGIGLLLVGALIGPHTLNLVHDQQLIDFMIDFGAILLLFVIGLEFAVSKLLKIGAKAVVFGLLKTGITFFITYQVLTWIGFNPHLGIILGIILSFSSTVVIVKILESKNLYNRQEMPLLIGVLFIEDILAVIVLTFLTKSSGGGDILNMFEQIFISVSVLILIYIVMLRIAEPVISWLLKNSSDDLAPFMALGTCVGFSCLSGALGFTPATGAFLAGSIVASCPHVNLFKYSIKPYTEVFTSLFFISMGMMVNFANLKPLLPLIFTIFLLVLVSRFIGVGLISSIIANFRKDQMVFSSMAALSVSEFSLLIAQHSMKFNLGIDLVSLTAFTIFITSLFMSLTITHYNRISSMLDSRVPKDWSNKPKSLSKYINIMLHELDTENSNTRTFKKIFVNSIAYVITILLVLLVWKKLVYALPAEKFLLVYTIHAASLTFIFYISFLLYRKLKKMYNILNVILSNNYAYNLKRSAKILNILLLVITLFLVTIYSPFMLVSAPLWLNILPFMLLIFIIIKLVKIVGVIDDFNSKRSIFPEYKKSETFFPGNIKGGSGE